MRASTVASRSGALAEELDLAVACSSFPALGLAPVQFSYALFYIYAL